MHTTQLLIVDDDPTLRTLLLEHYDSRGCHCEVAANGQEALPLLASGRFHVLVTDLDMPCMDGLALLKAVREQGLITRSVVITGYATLANLTSCIRQGALALVPKPIDLAVLDEAVDQAVAMMRRWTEQIGAILRMKPAGGKSKALEPRSDGHAC